MCSDGQGLASYDGQTFNHYTRENSLIPSNNLGYFAIDSLDNLWILSDGGAIKYDGNTYTEFNRVKGTFYDTRAVQIVVDSKNIVWITTDIGLARYDGTSWSLLTSENSGLPLPGTYLYSIAVDSNNLWFDSEAVGLVKYNGSSFSVFNTLNSGLLSLSITGITADTYGNKWLSTLDGISVFREGGVITSAEEPLNYYKEAKVYPNPAYNEVIFEFDAETGTGYQIEITDKTGTIIKSDIIQPTSTSQMRYTFKTNNIPTGDYYYKITNGSKHLQGKFIVLK
jgi:ligand-binding sensor domain-containing protein